jgi:hypothetical protein
MSSAAIQHNSSKYARRDDVVSRCIAGETIIVPVRSRAAEVDSIYRLDPIGSFIWERLDGITSADGIVDSICETYETTRATATHDLLEFLGTLESIGLIERCSQTA